MIRIFIVDDQSVVRYGLKSLLEIQTDLTVIGDAGNGQDALAAITSLEKSLQPDVVLLDVRMPAMNGVVTTQELSQRFPEIKVLILTTFDHDEYISQAINYGAKGYLLKDSSPEDLAMAIRAVNKGYTHLGPGLMQKMLQRSPQPGLPMSSFPNQLEGLSLREREVLNLIAKGINNREIAAELYISEKTVKNHVTSILSKLNLRDRTQAAVLANQLQATLKD
ncbi:MAG: response regulator transcription factor [Cyanothece sp. SIO1E1]|nr:response regulator transcription factor [Cyanothece sp. SIO1E1]